MSPRGGQRSSRQVSESTIDLPYWWVDETLRRTGLRIQWASLLGMQEAGTPFQAAQ